MLDIKEIWLNSCKKLLQDSEGAFPAGNNGPHEDEETPVRTTAHMLYMLCKLVELGHIDHLERANNAADYLLSDKARPLSASFWCRKNPDKDFCNGLVGQAWVMESLVFASKVLKRDDCMLAVEDVLSKHKWSTEYSAWHTLNVDGSNGPVCETFNQQLWFVYISLMMKKGSSNYQQGLDFINKVLPQVKLYNDGVIYHDAPAYDMNSNRSLKFKLRRFNRFINIRKRMTDQRARSVGYHSFILVALKGIKKTLPDHSFWKGVKYQKISTAITKDKYKNEVKNNKFAYPYNPIGFENAYFLQEDSQELAKEYYQSQLEYIELINQELFVKESFDLINSIARLYESCRLHDTVTVH
jgi:hypothetical protein